MNIPYIIRMIYTMCLLKQQKAKLKYTKIVLLITIND